MWWQLAFLLPLLRPVVSVLVVSVMVLVAAVLVLLAVVPWKWLGCWSMSISMSVSGESGPSR
jgi:hypothetical protein